MKKRNIIILTLVSTVFSLGFIILTYFGIIRYITLRVSPSTKLIENYSKLPKADDKHRVIVSFTTTPDNIKKLKPMLNSVLDQTVKVDKIVLVKPYKYKGQEYNLPKYITDIASICPSGKDYGKGTKIIPVLLTEKECDTIIIALDDNYVYGKDYIETIVNEINKQPETVLVDPKNSTIAIQPKCFSNDVIDREKETFDTDWFTKKAKQNNVIQYSENIRSF